MKKKKTFLSNKDFNCTKFNSKLKKLNNDIV